MPAVVVVIVVVVVVAQESDVLVDVVGVESLAVTFYLAIPIRAGLRTSTYTYCTVQSSQKGRLCG